MEKKKVTAVVFDRLKKVLSENKAYFITLALDDINREKIESNKIQKFIKAIYNNCVSQSDYNKFFEDCKKRRVKVTDVKQMSYEERVAYFNEQTAKLKAICFFDTVDN